MYQEHPIFTPPLDDATLWRYMDFTKFVSLLDRRALFFARADRLGDPFEGSLSMMNVIARPIFYRTEYPQYSDEDIEQMMRNIGSGVRGSREYVLVNCWHENPLESDFMWKLYAKDNYGVAIVTGGESLKKSGVFQSSQSWASANPDPKSPTFPRNNANMTLSMVLVLITKPPYGR